MSHSVDVAEFPMKPESLKEFKYDLLARVYKETHARLLLYQQGNCFRTNTAIKHWNRTSISGLRDGEEPMPPKEVLNDIKLDKEVEALKNIFKVAYESLAKEHLSQADPYTDLRKAIDVQRQTNSEFENLTNEWETNKIIAKSLEDGLQKEQREANENLSQKAQRVKFLREQLNNTKRVNRLEVRLVEKWEINRLGQATLVGEKKERALLQEILNLHRSMDNEKRLIYEIQSFRNNEISELKRKLAHWEQKYQIEKLEIEKKNIMLKQNIAALVKAQEKRVETTEQRKIFVNEYLQQKAVEERLHREQLYRIECAVHIQAWWRGTMVRRGLGPYRKKSKKVRKCKSKKLN